MALMIGSQVSWWFFLFYLGRVEDPFQVALLTLTVGVLSFVVPSTLIQSFSKLPDRTAFFCASVFLAVVIQIFFLTPRTFGDAQGLVAASEILWTRGPEHFASHYFSLPFLGSVHPPLGAVVYTPWIGAFGVSMGVLAFFSSFVGVLIVYLSFLFTRRAFSRDIAVLSVVCLFGCRHFWLYLCTPGLDGLLAVGVLLFMLGMTSRRTTLATVGFGIAIFSKYIGLFLVLTAPAWRESDQRRRFMKAIGVGAFLFCFWLGAVVRDGRQLAPISRHLLVSPVFTQKGEIVKQPTGAPVIATSHLQKSSWYKKRFTYYIGFFLSQGPAFLLLFLASCRTLTSNKEFPPELRCWLGAFFALILLLPISRYFAAALPAACAVVGLALQGVEPGWRYRILLFQICTALIAVSQYPAVPYNNLVEITGAS